jgi:hypothetical protein
MIAIFQVRAPSTINSLTSLLAKRQFEETCIFRGFRQ